MVRAGNEQKPSDGSLRSQVRRKCSCEQSAHACLGAEKQTSSQLVVLPYLGHRRRQFSTLERYRDGSTFFLMRRQHGSAAHAPQSIYRYDAGRKGHVEDLCPQSLWMAVGAAGIPCHQRRGRSVDGLGFLPSELAKDTSWEASAWSCPAINGNPELRTEAFGGYWQSR